MFIRFLFAAAALLAFCLPAFGQSVSPEALKEAKQMMQVAVDSGDVAGASHLVWFDGKVVHFAAAGVRDIESGKPFQRDTIVRIYSMSKPITSVAAMILYERGAFELDDPVSKFVPAFAEIKVAQGRKGKTTDPVRPITVRDLLRHTTGYGYSGGQSQALNAAYNREGMRYHPPQGIFPPEMSIREAADALSRIPIHHQPGKRFTYGFSTDLLGRLIEIWSGKSLDEFMSEEVFQPLKMVDTGFAVPEEKRDRFASLHTIQSAELAILDKSSSSPYNDGFEFLSGGGGLVSTIDDYSKFCAMLVGEGKSLLKPETIDLMFSDQLGGVAGDFQFGLGFAIKSVELGKSDERLSATEVSWAGYASTDFRIVPKAKLFQIYFRQRVPSQHELARKTFLIVNQGYRPSGTTADPPVQDVSSNWPGWLGPNRDGWVPDFTPPDRWPTQLTKQWQVTVGAGYGTPIVVGDAVYQHARQDGDEVLWCLDRKTGETRWRQSYPVAFKMGGGGESHGKGPKSNAIYADGRLFTFSITGVLTAWDAQTGSQLWQSDKAVEFKTTTPYWGASTSPVVDGDRVIVHYGNDERGVLVAHDVETGAEVWRQGNDGAAYSSPLIAQIDGVRQVIEWNHRAIVGVQSETGQKLWEQPLEHVGTNQNMPTPSFYQGCILVGGENRGVYSFYPRRDGEDWTVSERWFQDEVALDMSSAVVNDGFLYGFSHYNKGQLFCLDTKDGAIKWRGPGRAGENVTFLAIPNHVVALMNDGELKVLKADESALIEVASYEVADAETWSAPVVLSDGILIKDENTLTKWGLTKE